MRCKCGNEIANVPEHLRDLVEWMCQKCTNTTPKSQSLPSDFEPYGQRSIGIGRRRKDSEADAA